MRAVLQKSVMHFCFKLQEKYILPHSTYISIMKEIITLFSEFHHLVLTNAQNQFNQIISFITKETDLLEKNYLTKIWNKLKHEAQFESTWKPLDIYTQQKKRLKKIHINTFLFCQL